MEFESLLLCKAGIVIEGRDAASRKTCGREATNNADPDILDKVHSTD
jgi:hypothetical protein